MIEIPALASARSINTALPSSAEGMPGNGPVLFTKPPFLRSF
jgi:hypothetical protein